MKLFSYHRIFAAIFNCLFIFPIYASAEQHLGFDHFGNYVENDETLQGSYWLEMQNAFGQWEKMILVFGYANPGDKAACEEIIHYATRANLNRQYRCSRVVAEYASDKQLN